MTASLAVVQDGEGVAIEPSEKQLAGCKSVHAMVFTAQGQMLLDESAGQFDIEQWEDVEAQLRKAALTATAASSEDKMMVNGNAEATPWLREALETSVRAGGAWREAG